MLNFLFKIAEIIQIFIIFILHSVYKLCFSSGNKRARFYFNYFIYYFNILLSGIFFLPLLIFKGRNLDNVNFLNEIHTYLGQKVLGLELTVRNYKVLEKHKEAIVVANHQSSVEVLIYYQIHKKLLKRCMPISKRELLYFFPYGPLSYLMGTMFVTRNKGGNDELDRIAKELIKEQAKIMIMPEGTRNHVKGTMLPFKRGAFYLAIKAQVPIIPIAMSPFYFIDYDAKSFGKPRITMQVLDPVSTEGLTMDDLPELKERVRNQVLEAYQKLCQEFLDEKKGKQDCEEYTGDGFVKLVE